VKTEQTTKQIPLASLPNITVPTMAIHVAKEWAEYLSDKETTQRSTKTISKNKCTSKKSRVK